MTETVDPTTGLTTINIPRSSGVWLFPDNCMPLDFKFTIKKAAGDVITDPVVTLTTPTAARTFDDDVNHDNGWLSGPDGDGFYTVHVRPCVEDGDL